MRFRRHTHCTFHRYDFFIASESHISEALSKELSLCRLLVADMGPYAFGYVVLMWFSSSCGRKVAFGSPHDCAHAFHQVARSTATEWVAPRIAHSATTGALRFESIHFHLGSSNRDALRKSRVWRLRKRARSETGQTASTT